MLNLFRAALGIVISMWSAWAAAEEAKPLPVASSSATAAPLSEEYLQRWTPGGDTNAADLPYPHVTAAFQRENDDDWRDDRWQRTDKGPFVSHSIVLPEHEVGSKLTAIAARAGKFLLYDLEAGSFVAGVTSGDLRTDPARFGLLNRPLLVGDVAFYRPAENMWRHGQRNATVPVSAIDYQGLHLSGDRVLLVSRVADVEVLESPLPCDGAAIVVSDIELGPHAVEMWLTVAVGDDRLEIAEDGRAATWIDRQGKRRLLAIDAASPGVKLERDGAAILLHWPAADISTSAQVSYRAEAANGAA